MSDPIRKRVLPPAKIPFLVVQVECEGGKGAPAIPDSLRGQAFSSLVKLFQAWGQKPDQLKEWSLLLLLTGFNKWTNEITATESQHKM